MEGVQKLNFIRWGLSERHSVEYEGNVPGRFEKSFKNGTVEDGPGLLCIWGSTPFT